MRDAITLSCSVSVLTFPFLPLLSLSLHILAQTLDVLLHGLYVFFPGLHVFARPG